MLILTEKSSVAKDFSQALSCTFSNGIYKNQNIVITNCIGHLFKEESPLHYSSDFPVIPTHWDYCLSDDKQKACQAKLVISLLKEHKNDTIIIATDADREGEIIARECLLKAEITNFSHIKRFWVSQALTPQVIQEGLKNAKPLDDYNFLAAQGFARQHADWLVGMNFSRFITNVAKTKLSVGRVQTAILCAIEQRCDAIKNFKSEKYFEHFGIFQPTRGGSKISCKGIYFENDKTSFPDNFQNEKLKMCIGKNAKIINQKTEKKTQNPPQLYNLNALQKDAFKFFDYSAEKTLEIVQSLYEKLKCVSYPRTPSRVMGSQNVDLCKNIANNICKHFSHYEKMNISITNKHCFNDEKLEAHHALIPLKDLPENVSEEQASIYKLIFDRFCISFLPPFEYEKQTYILCVEKNNFKITGRKTINLGWKEILTSNNRDECDENDEEQSLENINWDNLILCDVNTKEKWTAPPSYFNESSILSFMENPKDEKNETKKKLVGLGTAATRHSFIPLLKNRGYITTKNKNFLITDLGRTLLNAIRSTAIKNISDIAMTTDWEERLNENPEKYLEEIKNFVQTAVLQNTKIEIPHTAKIFCPLCKNEIRKGKINWFCTNYQNGCNFKIWDNVASAKISQKDVELLCSGKQTEKKHCINKNGKKFDCRFKLNEQGTINFIFENR